jgi:putative flippase GtrA
MAEFWQLIKNLWQKHREVLLWALGGGVNTLLTYGLYLLFNLFLHFQVAFTASYVIGIIFAYFYNSLVVFKSPLSYMKFALFPVVYLFQYLLSIVLLAVFVQRLQVSETLAPIFVLIIVTPVTYLLSKLILKEKNRPVGE